MKLSIVIPVYRTEDVLKRCLDSFAEQTDGDFEAIVVDDCSTGNCQEIVARYDARFRYVRHERNLGLLQARITGLKAATGDVVVPFDSDDYAQPELLARLKAEFAADAETDVVVYQMQYDDGRRIRMPSVRYRDERMSGAEALDRLFASRIQCAICGKAVRRETYLKAVRELDVTQDFHLNSSEDLLQTFPVLLNARKVSTLSYPGYRYWTNPDSLSTTLTDPARMGKAAENVRRVFDTLERLVRANGYDLGLVTRLEKFAEPTLEWYLGCIRHLPEERWRACAAELCKFFPPDLVARKAMTLVEGSMTFRLGRLLTLPLRLIRGKS